MVLPTVVLCPLYMYPTRGAWNPLFNAITSNPNLNFTVIVNPDSGPGGSAYPDPTYIAGVQQLNTYPNVQTVGYVHVSWTARPITDVLNDIAIYSGWNTASSANNVARGSLAMHGIFFDETPDNYNTSTWTYLNTINAAVKNSPGLLGAKTVIHNAGTITDPGLKFTNLDITVVFESTYKNYLSMQSALNALTGPRSSYAYMINSLPASMKSSFVTTLSLKAEYLFLTVLTSNPYAKYDSIWSTWITWITTR